MFKILEKKLLGPKIHYMLVEAPLIASKAEAGQFIIVTLSEKSERIPLTIADYDREKGTITMVYQELGKSSTEMSMLRTGDTMMGVLGPQGNPSEIENFGNVVVIGGGIGIAPTYPISRKLKEHGNHVTTIIGYRSQEHVFWEDRMRAVSSELVIATNDGSYGRQGFVTDMLKEIADSGKKIDRVFAIGPVVMMKAVAELTRQYGIKTIVSLNSLMVCGMGMCGACRVTVGGKTRFTCMDGPEFDAHEVDFDELIMRLGTYKEEEKACMDGFCK